MTKINGVFFPDWVKEILAAQTGPFYIVSVADYGPDSIREGKDGKVYEISLSPSRTNMSHEIRTEGWLGQANDTNRHACGEHDTVEELLARLAEECGDDMVKGGDWEDFTNQYEEDGFLLQFDPVDGEVYGHSDTYDWITGPGWDVWDITAETTDEELSEMAADAEKSALQEQSAVLTDTLEILTKRRDELKAEQDEAE